MHSRNTTTETIFLFLSAIPHSSLAAHVPYSITSAEIREQSQLGACGAEVELPRGALSDAQAGAQWTDQDTLRTHRSAALRGQATHPPPRQRGVHERIRRPGREPRALPRPWGEAHVVRS